MKTPTIEELAEIAQNAASKHSASSESGTAVLPWSALDDGPREARTVGIQAAITAYLASVEGFPSVEEMVKAISSPELTHTSVSEDMRIVRNLMLTAHLAERQKWEMDLANLVEMRDDWDKRCAEAEAKLAAVRALPEKWRNLADKMIADGGYLNGRMFQCRSSADQLESALSAAPVEPVPEVKEDPRTLEREQANYIAALQEQRSQLQSRVDELETQVEEFKARAEAAEARVKSLEESVETLSNLHLQACGKVEAYVAEKEHLESRIAALTPRPVSVKPTKEDGDVCSDIVVYDKDGSTYMADWKRIPGDTTHWLPGNLSRLMPEAVPEERERAEERLPLSVEDIPSGCLIKTQEAKAVEFRVVQAVEAGVMYVSSHGNVCLLTYNRLADWLILRPGSPSWQKCWKLARAGKEAA